MKKLYGVGTGPGSKEFLTLKAVDVIKKAKVLFAPNNKGKNMALDTIEDFIDGQKIVLIDFPMGNVTKKDYIDGANIIYKEIPDGGIGAFLTIGDPMIYSTFIYIMRELEDMDIDIEIVPGIPSFLAGAAKSKMPLTVKGDRFLLCDELREGLPKEIDSICILKTLKDENIIKDKDEILKDKDYISLIMGRRREND